jgi:hypothetical protein
VLTLRFGSHSDHTQLEAKAEGVGGEIVPAAVHDSDNDSRHLLEKVIWISEMENVVVFRGLAAEYPFASRLELAGA